MLVAETNPRCPRRELVRRQGEGEGVGGVVELQAGGFAEVVAVELVGEGCVAGNDCAGQIGA